MAELTELSTTERDQFLDEVSIRHPITVVDMEEDSVQVRYLDNLHIIQEPDCDVANVVEVCNLLIRHYKDTDGFDVYPLDSYVDKDMATRMIELNIPGVLSDIPAVLSDLPSAESDSILDDPVEEDMKAILEEINVLKGQVSELSLLVKRMAVQYGVLMGPKS